MHNAPGRPAGSGKEIAAGALGNLAFNNDNKVLIAQAGAIQPLLKAIQAGPPLRSHCREGGGGLGGRTGRLLRAVSSYFQRSYVPKFDILICLIPHSTSHPYCVSIASSPQVFSNDAHRTQPHCTAL